jgi:hypothetical protein
MKFRNRRVTRVSKIRVRLLVWIPLKSLAPEPAVDPFGDCLPSWLKHHDVPHVGKDLHLCLVGLRHGKRIPVDSHAIILCAENKHRCCYEASVGKSHHQISCDARALGF